MMKKYEYTEVSPNSIGIKHKLQTMIGGNGDYYLSVCPGDRSGGPTIRIETSGGASTRNHEMTLAVSLLHKALKEDKEDFWSTIDQLAKIK